MSRNVLRRLLTFPIMLGRGKRLFDNAAIPRSWTLEKSVSSSTGVVMNRSTYKAPAFLKRLAG